jgi:radical SAM protein with 4Fe4S-binding SPASM domain
MNATTPDLPRELQVEVTGACNLSCRMCLVRYRPRLGRAEGSMSFATFASLLDELPDLEVVTLQGLGEPLLAPDLPRMIDLAASRGVRMGFNTNGTLLTRAWSERLVAAGLAWLHVSLDGARPATYEDIRTGSDFARVRANVLDLVAAKRRAGAELPALSLVFVVMRRNIADLPQVVRLTAEWGVGRLWVQSLSHGFEDAGPGYREIRDFTAAEALWEEGEETAATFAAAREEADRLGVELRLPKLEERPARRRPGEPGCDWPWRSTYVTHDGVVQPCCMVMGSERAAFGRLEEASFAETWTNADAADFRERLLGDDPPEVCRGCAMYRGRF